MKFSADRMEFEYLSGAAPSEVLRYLDEKGASAKPTFFSKPCVSEALEERLFQRNDRVVDIGLARVASSEMVARLIERRASLTDADAEEDLDSDDDPRSHAERRMGEPDSSLMVAALSNTSECGWWRANRWLLQWLHWIAHKGGEEHLAALFENPGVPNDVVDAALLRKSAFDNLTQDRYNQILSYALKSKPALTEPEDTNDGPDSMGHHTVGCAWAVLLHQDPSDVRLSNILAEALPKIPRVEVLYDTHDALGIPKGAPTDWDLAISNGRLADFRFLEVVFSRWKLDSEKVRTEEWDEWQPRRLVREITASKAGFYNEKVKALVLEHDDVYVRRGYYRGFSSETLENLKKYFEHDRADFCEAAIENDFFHGRKNRDAAAWLFERCFDCIDDKVIDSLGPRFAETLERKHEADPVNYFKSVDEILDPALAQSSSDISHGIGGVYDRLEALRIEVLGLAQLKSWFVIALAAAIGFVIAKLHIFN